MTAAVGDRVVVITGANGGIGRNMLSTLAEDGYRVAGLDVNGENVRSLEDPHADRVQYIECDVTKTKDVEAAISNVVDEWGGVDILVNNAGIAHVAPFDEQPTAETRREFEVNYFGYRRTIRAVLPHMRSRGTGIIHNVSSGTALAGHPWLTGYASTKGAIEGFVRSLRLELDDEDIWCTLMQPPTTATTLTADLGYPSWFLNDPADVGRKLAGKIESTDPVVYADLQTRIGLSLIQRFPSLWRRGIQRYSEAGR